MKKGEEAKLVVRPDCESIVHNSFLVILACFVANGRRLSWRSGPTVSLLRLVPCIYNFCGHHCCLLCSCACTAGAVLLARVACPS